MTTTTQNKKRRFCITAFVPEQGTVQHVTRGWTEQAAIRRIERAYPNKTIHITKVVGDLNPA